MCVHLCDMLLVQQEVGLAYLSDVHCELVLCFTVLITQRTNEG